MGDYEFDINIATPLCEIMGRNNSDKGNIDIKNSWHNYTPIYYALFKDLRDKELRIFELGLGTNNINLPSNMGINGTPGASVYGWKEFFPNSQIYGADIDKDILFNTDRIKTYYCDQTNKDIIEKMWNHPDLQENFDIIIEDGLHELEANVCFFENSIHKLKSKGYYIIEDIIYIYKELFLKKIEEWKIKYSDCLFKLLEIPSEKNKYYDNRILIVHKK